MFTPGFLLFPLLIPVDSSWQRWQKCLFDGKRWLPHWQGKIPRSESCNPSKYINMWQAKRTWFLSELYHGKVEIGHVEELRDPHQTGIWQRSDEMYIVHSAHESAICSLWMVHGIVIFYAYKISWNKELFTTFSYSVSFSCLIFLGAFHTSRLLSDACIFVRFNSLRGLYTSFIMKATISLVFPRLSAFATLRNTRSLLGREKPVTNFCIVCLLSCFFVCFLLRTNYLCLKRDPHRFCDKMPSHCHQGRGMPV